MRVASLGLRLGLAALCAVCFQGNSARADEPRRLLLDPPRLLLGATPSATAGAAPTDSPSLSQAQVDWLAFGADALLELGTSAVETGVALFGVGLLDANNDGAGVLSLLAVGLMLAIHPALDAFLVDAIARVSHQTEPSFLGTLIGSYVGCALGAGGFILAVVTLESWPVVELVVASLLDALLPAATTVLTEILTRQKLREAPTPGNAVARSDPPGETNQAAWKSALADPVARWAF